MELHRDQPIFTSLRVAQPQNYVTQEAVYHVANKQVLSTRFASKNLLVYEATAVYVYGKPFVSFLKKII